MKLIFATHNQHKVKELKKLVPPSISILSLTDIKCYQKLRAFTIAKVVAKAADALGPPLTPSSRHFSVHKKHTLHTHTRPGENNERVNERREIRNEKTRNGRETK